MKSFYLVSSFLSQLVKADFNFRNIMRKVLTLLFLLAGMAGFSQSTSQEQQTSELGAEGDEIFVVVDEIAKPVGGMPAFYEVIGQNINFPKAARNKHIVGKVFVQFVIEKDGSVSEIKTIKGIGYGCDQEAERVIALSPKWIPGRLKGQPVRQRFVLPITFNAPGKERKSSNE